MKKLFDLLDPTSYPSRNLKQRSEKDTDPQPFIQWVGGKRQLISRYEQFFPEKYGNYYEPFAGGAAIFYWQYNKFAEDKEYFLSDMNQELVITYNVIKQQPEDLIEILKVLNEKHSKQFYYDIRNIDRQSVGEKKYKKLFSIVEEIDPVSIAARFIYLNKTCFNGIYRVSGDGTFNVPIGKTLSKNVCNEEKILSASRALKNVTITHEPYENVLEKASEGDLVFFDPPYEPISETSSFTSYTTGGFTFEDQIKLKQIFDSLVQKGCNVLLSNSNSEKIIELYSDYRIEQFEVNRNLNSKADKRKNSAVEVLVIGKKEKKALHSTVEVLS